MSQPVSATQRGFRGQPAVILLHRLPTRLRLGVAAIRDNGFSPTAHSRAETYAESSPAEVVEKVIRDLEGVTRVQANGVTGSLLVEHDGAPGREEEILTALFDVVPSDTPLADEPQLLANLMRVGEVLNRTALRVSRGQLDLKTALPLLLGIYGLSRLLTERPLRPPSGLTMVWWAYTSMRQLARESRR
jgi:hypothetical protein